MKIFYALTFIIILISGNFLLGNSPSLKIQITPPIYEREVRRGETLSFQIALQNNSEKQVRLKGYVLSFQIDKNGKPVFVDGPYLPFSCQSWIDIAPKSFNIKAAEQREVTISIKVPDDATGGNYASVLFDVESGELPSKGSQVGIAIRTGSLILLTVRNTIKMDAQIESFQIAQQPGKSIFEVLLRNNSNIHLKPSGSIVIFKDDKRVVDRINFKESTFIMPQSERLLRIAWENPKKRLLNNTYAAECRFQIKGLGKSLIQRKEFDTIQ